MFQTICVSLISVNIHVYSILTTCIIIIIIIIITIIVVVVVVVVPGRR